MNSKTIEQIADLVLNAQDNAHPLKEKLSTQFPGLGVAEAYEVQDEIRRRWLARGERMLGFKVGFTSKSGMEQMSSDRPGFGMLTASMARPENGVVEIDQLVHPRVEAEIAFMLDRELSGPELSIDDVLSATDYVIPAVEIVDSRCAGSVSDMPSAIANNSSSARFITGGRPMEPSGPDLGTLGVVLEKNGNIEALGAGAAVLNHPANAIIWLAKHLSERGETIPAGSLILSGGITEPVPLAPGDSIVARFQNMGSLSFRIS